MLAYKAVRIGLFSDYYLASSDGTAIATQISRQALSGLGHEVKVFCPNVPGARKKAYVQALPSLPGFFYPGLRLSWPFSHTILAEVNGLDILHIETPLPVGLLGLWAARKVGKPIVVSSHLDMDFLGEYGVAPLALFGLGLLVALICRQPGGFLRTLFSRRQNPGAGRRVDFAWRVFAFFCDQADVCVAISQKIYDQLNIYKRKDNLILVPNGVSLPLNRLPSQKDIRRQFGWGADEFIVISLARLVREKRVNQIIEAVKLLPEESRLKLMIFNDGPEAPRLKKLVQQLGLESRVQFHGLVPRQDLYKYLIAADVYANASLREVASLAVLEAASCGKPLLLFDKRLTEPLEDGLNGFFVNDKEQLAAKLAWLIRHPQAVYSLGVSSRRRIKTRYSQASHGRALANLYGHILKGH